MKDWHGHISKWWQALIQPESAGQLVLEYKPSPGFDRFLIIGITLLYAVYGLSMGLFRGYFAGIVSALKLPFLFIFTLLICFPPLYVLNCIMGPKLKARHCYRLLLMATSANAVALASYAPFSYFFTLTTSREGYHFLVMMHVGVFALSGIISTFVIAIIFRATAIEMGQRLKPMFIIAWSVLYAFVGTQMSWTLRPWIGSWFVPYTPFRTIEGSFIESVWRIIF